MMLKDKNNITDILAKARWILPVLLWISLSLFAKEFLLKVEERSIFEFDSFWLKEFLDKPSGIISYCGLFFTQFLHIHWLGALIWVLLLAVSAELTRIVFKISTCYSIWTYIPVAIMVTYNMSMGYLVYQINLPGYFFIPVLGCLWTLLTVYILKKTEKTVSSIIITIFLGVAGYYFAGFYGLAAIGTAGIDTALSERDKKYRLSSLVVAIIIILIAPLLFVGTTTYNISAGWTIGLPEKIFEVPRTRLQLPLVLTMLCLLITPIISRFFTPKTGIRSVLIQGITMAAVIALPFSLWFKDDNYNAELGMIRATDNLEWNKAIDIFEKVSAKHEKDISWQPTRVMVLLKDLALIKTGQEGDKAFTFDDGSQQQNCKWIIPTYFLTGKILYFHYGLPDLCHRWCIEESVLYGWNANICKYIVMNSILLDDIQLAEKYLAKMEHTLFYRKWAKKQRLLCNDRKSVSKTAPYDLIIPLMCYEDDICSDKYGSELTLINHFNGATPQNSTPLYDRVALLFAMKSKQPTLFLTKFYIFLDSNSPKKIGRSYLEATYLYGNITDNKILLEAFPFENQTKNLYKSFVQKASLCDQKTLEGSKQFFPAALRKTFYYYYYYVNELTMF